MSVPTAVIFLLLLSCVACGGGSSSSSTSGTVAISISPSTATIPVGSSQQFTATVSNASDNTVTWQVNDTTGGSSTYGTISSTGLYTAPTTVPASSITIKAISTADTSKSATATVSVSNANKLTMNPATATLAAGGQQTFSALLGDQSVDANWSLSCSSTTAGACGTITFSGVYTAPLAPPRGQVVTVTASSKNNTATAVSGAVTVTFGSGTLLGQYAFVLTGSSAGNPFREVGSIRFNGKGGIAGGTLDRSGNSSPIAITGGTYITDAKGRVTATIHTDSGDEGWQITLVSHTRALAMRVDSVIARGDLDLQDSLQFGGVLSGNFSVRLAGTATTSVPAVGQVGMLTFGAQGNITAGAMDANDGGTIWSNVSAGGTSTASDATFGRGTITLASSFGTQTIAYYVVDSGFAKLIEIDGLHDLGGEAVVLSPPSTTGVSRYSGAYGFVLAGANSSGTIGQAGTFNVDLNGNVSNGTVDIATDTAYALGFLVSGSFSTPDAQTGRCLVTLNVGGSTLQFAAYPPDRNFSIPLLEIDNKNVTSGVALRQSNAINGGSLPTVSGQFALLAGETNTTIRRTVMAGMAMSSLPTGTVDTVDDGNITLDSPMQDSSFSVTSLYGRAKLRLQTASYKSDYSVFILDTDTLLIMQSDGKAVLTGIARKQY